MAPRLPNLVIAGTNKAGTTSLFAYLKEHPDVCASGVKETCHFLTVRYGEPPRSMEEYYAFFRHCGGQRYVMESTPGYFYGGRAVAERLEALRSDMRIIIILREPAARAFSFYRFQKNMLALPASLTFEEYVERCLTMPAGEKKTRAQNPYWGIDGGFYTPYLQEWFDVFGERVKLLFFEALRDSPWDFLGEVCAWLELDMAPLRRKGTLGVENRTLDYRSALLHRPALALNRKGEKFLRAHPRFKRLLRNAYQLVNAGSPGERMRPETSAMLAELYREPNRRLASLLSKRGIGGLPEWLKQPA